MAEESEIRIADLATRFDVSLMTMHRDLDVLAERHMLRKERGRAVAYPALTMETATRFREDANLAEKRAMCNAGIRVGIVSDFAWDLRIHLKHHDLAELVDTCVISYELGREKPDPELFLTACDRMGVDPRATLMVGDNPTRDGGAVACGLRAYLLPAEPRTGERGLNHVLDFIH